MANRTFKVYGQAYAASGDVSVAMTINGTQVFNGAVNDSSTVRSGAPSTENHLFTFELDEDTTGNLNLSLAVSGGELCLGPVRYNGIRGPVIPMSWFDSNGYADYDATAQAYLATNIGEDLLNAEQAGLYDKLVAGNATNADVDDIARANEGNGDRNFGTDADDFVATDADQVTNLAIDGTALSDVSAEQASYYWPIISDGSTYTCTWDFSPDTYGTVV